MRQTYTVACLAGDGLGPELMAEASRTLRKVARMHGFEVEDVHAPFGSEALTRSGHPLPATTRTAVLDADAVLARGRGRSRPGRDRARPRPARGADTGARRAAATSSLLTPGARDADDWTVERAFDARTSAAGTPRRRRPRRRRWAALVDEVDSARDVALDRLDPRRDGAHARLRARAARRGRRGRSGRLRARRPGRGRRRRPPAGGDGPAGRKRAVGVRARPRPIRGQCRARCRRPGLDAARRRRCCSARGSARSTPPTRSPRRSGRPARTARGLSPPCGGRSRPRPATSATRSSRCSPPCTATPSSCPAA